MKKKIISSVAVFGSGNCEPGSPQYLLGEKMGQLIAEACLDVVTGGLGGVMEAASKGAKKAGGHTIGFTMLGKQPNDWIDKVIDCQHQSVGVDGKGIIDSDTEQYGRQLGRLLNSDGLIAVVGDSSGTFAEVLTFAHLARKGLVKHKWLAVVYLESETARASFWCSFLGQLFHTGSLTTAKGTCLFELNIAFVSPERAIDCTFLGWEGIPD